MRHHSAADGDDMARAEVDRVARHIRSRVMELTLLKDGCYLSQALSSADILAVLYAHVLRLESLEAPLAAPPFAGVPGAPGGASPSGGRFHGRATPNGDRFFISPAHYAAAIYAALEGVGRLAPGELESFNVDGSTLEMIGAEHSPGFELTTGSFGQALSQSAGIAFARRLKGESGRTYVFMSDGELEEGQTWEGVQAAAFYKLDRLVLVVDVNGQQVDGYTKDVMNIEPIPDRFTAFGWDVREVNGHDIRELIAALDVPPGTERPRVVLARTDTARGVPYLEKYKPNLHYVRPKTDEDREQFKLAFDELKVGTP
jgi:transketolase